MVTHVTPWLPLLCQDACRGPFTDLLSLTCVPIKRSGALGLYDALAAQGATLRDALGSGFLWDPRNLSKGGCVLLLGFLLYAHPRKKGCPGP